MLAWHRLVDQILIAGIQKGDVQNRNDKHVARSGKPTLTAFSSKHFNGIHKHNE
jgi:hypothetical protein